MISVRGVTKRFGPTVALDDVSFQLERGEILGFLGPNGAGKSTAMKIITTFLAPEAGSVLVDGLDVSDEPLAVRQRIGYLPENNPLYVDMLVREYLEFVGAARGLSGGALRGRMDWVIDACGIGNVIGKPISALSKGYKQRTGLAQALIHDPDILILDEPTSGLDPLQIIGIRDLIKSLSGEKTIIFSTHILQEVSPVTDRVVIINDGRIIADGMIPELTERAMGANRTYVSVLHDAAEVETTLAEIEGVSRVALLHETAVESRFELSSDFNTDLRTTIGGAVRARGWELVELGESRFSLEETFETFIRQSRERREVNHV